VGRREEERKRGQGHKNTKFDLFFDMILLSSVCPLLNILHFTITPLPPSASMESGDGSGRESEERKGERGNKSYFFENLRSLLSVLVRSSFLRWLKVVEGRKGDER